ncbi:hypothetical protein NQ317_003860 [Molorchus minor]|uniref:CKK domain-containing protein n=1 Tax=Molorchus minor TaxID=1323400 RepID=A0ABQ9JD46_9CUCU|nr:hypothetical protein NQ317_003860 [Molorchus minor]
MSNTNGAEKKTTFATLPNTTTWQQQSTNVQQHPDNADEVGGSGNVMNVQLNDIRMKLEEKRRHIESEKRRMEMAMNKQRQKVGKAAFLQAVAKGRGNLLKSPTEAESNNSAEGSDTQSPSTESDPTPKPQRPFTLQPCNVQRISNEDIFKMAALMEIPEDITEDATSVDRKWSDENQPFIETRRTRTWRIWIWNSTNSLLLSQMNSSLHDIQSDMQRLASQQNHLQQQQQQNIIAQQQRHIQVLQQQHQQQQFQSMQSPPQPVPQYTHQQSYQPQMYQPPQQVYAPPLQSSSSAPHIPQALFNQSRVQEQPQFFLHDQSGTISPTPPPRLLRKEEHGLNNPSLPPVEPYQQPELRTWGKPQSAPGGGFVLHDSSERSDNARYKEQPRYQESTRYSESPRYPDSKYQNGEEHTLHHSNNRVSREPPQRKTSVTHAPIPAPSADDMEPQNISFIGNSAGDKLSEGLSRVPSLEISSLDNDPTSQKGFYISFDNDHPIRPKPPLRNKRMSPKKERSYVESPRNSHRGLRIRRGMKRGGSWKKELGEERIRKDEEERRRQALIEQEREKLRAKREASQERQKVAAASAIIIGNDLSNPDPDLDYERERKKEKIMMLSLQRRQQQEEMKARKEAEAQSEKGHGKAERGGKGKEKGRTDSQAAGHIGAIQVEKGNRGSGARGVSTVDCEGKTLDRTDLVSLKPTPKMRPKGATRPRPKTIHIDSGSVQMAEGMSSRGKKGSTSNLTAYAPTTMKRDYYRGSQDSLADRSMSSGMLYKDSPDDSRGISPCHSANQTLGRRSSYKTSRDPSPAQVRGRPKYSAYQNFKGRKSSSMMNLYGKTGSAWLQVFSLIMLDVLSCGACSSTDQDSLAYRFGDTDSGLGRATPPRRAPSPGMSMRHLPSPSGPGSLPGLMSKGRRMFDDGSSDISSTPSSMMDYNGPRLYKQPATKSNRSIMLNAVEYCIFPGVVNREAKKRVLEEINRSESKHFLILFRDAGCQFRALYSYCPEREEITKLYGTGPKQVNDKMFDKFFKYNSGGKCFSQVHTKHLTVTIDAFTIHNSLWQGKKVNLPNKKGYGSRYLEPKWSL